MVDGNCRQLQIERSYKKMKKLIVILVLLLSSRAFGQNLRLEYNNTSKVKTVNLNGVYIDMRNVVHAGYIDLKPYCSMVLIKVSGPLPMKLEKYDVTAKDHVITITFTLDEDGVAKNYTFTYDNKTQ